MKTGVIAILSAGFLGCAVDPMPESTALGESTLSPPLVMTLHVTPSSQGSVLVARVELQRQAALGVPVEVVWELPSGVSMSQGKARETVPDGERSVTRIYEFRVLGVPADDLVVRAEAGGAHWGVIARQAYAFGRSPAAAVEAMRSPRSIRWRGVEMGHAIPLDSTPVKRR
ncbi:MAG: hypothetical protein HY904_11480 [Deltaproteobacteria bacterium]|nr:hypothetical protein [Deltaproteobacteria bacterium]